MGPKTFTITAANGVRPAAIQTFTLTVTAPSPAITSDPSATFTVAAGSAGAFAMTATGVPTPTLSESAALPPGVTFTDNANGTATLWIPAGTTPGTYAIDITAANGVSPDDTQTFTLAVNPAPVIPDNPRVRPASRGDIAARSLPSPPRPSTATAGGVAPNTYVTCSSLPRSRPPPRPDPARSLGRRPPVAGPRLHQRRLLRSNAAWPVPRRARRRGERPARCAHRQPSPGASVNAAISFIEFLGQRRHNL